ncbi:MAG: preprotein translocase subunit SecY [Colwellia polaris]|jgi:preprotein translocase subunit SecY
MSETLVKAAQYLPTVTEPEKEQTLKQMLTWTGIVLILYFLLSSIPVFTGGSTIASGALGQLQQFQTLVGAQIGTILTLGITPIITASIVLQMLVGSDVLPWNTNTDEGQLKFQSAQKLLAYGLTLFMALGYVLSGTFGNIGSLSTSVIALITGQIALGGVLIILMDDLVKKWGFGQGVSLFIAAGVSKQIIVGLISPLTESQDLFWQVDGNPVGAIINFAVNLEPSALLPALATLIVFAVAVYLQSMRVEIPLTFGNVRGFGQKWPLKFLYTSVMPIIFVGAIIANVQIVGSTLVNGNGTSILGTFSNGQAQSGFASYLNAPTGVIENLISGGIAAVGAMDVFHIFFYLAVYMVGSTVFSIFWARTSGQDSQSVAEQISETGMKVPGFRKDSRVIKKVLDRYIPGLTVLSGATMGLLAASANMTQAAGGGTGILLTVMIIYRMYEQLAQKQLEEIHPALGDFFQT